MTIVDDLQQLKERAHKLDLAAVQTRIERAEHDARKAEDRMAKAIAECDGDECARSLRDRDQALDEIRQAMADRKTLEENEPKPSFLSPLAALRVPDFGAMHIELPAKPRSFADCFSPVDLLDKHGIASYLAHQWFSENRWFATAHATQKTIIETLHHTLRAQGLCVSQPEYWTALSGLIEHLQLESFTLPKEVAPMNVQERILNIMQSLVDTINAPRVDDDTPSRKKARVRKKHKGASPAATPPEVHLA